MKKILIILLFSFAHTLLGQSLSIFNIDTTNFPTMKANLFALDQLGQEQSPNINTLNLYENSKLRTITNISCQAPGTPKILSSVLVIDVSGSMSNVINGSTNMELANAAAKAWVNSLLLGKSECAITSFDHLNYLNQDFTRDKTKLFSAIDLLKAKGGTDYDVALINPPAGGLLLTKNAKYQKVLVYLTDGLGGGTESNIINEAKNQNCVIYCVTLRMTAPDILKKITKQTGGMYFENVSSVKQAEDIYRIILQIAQGGKPCDITWTSDVSCNNGNNIVELNWNNQQSKIEYIPSTKSISSLQVSPSVIKFGKRTIASQNDLTIKLNAINSDYKINKIKFKNGSANFSILNASYPILIPKNTSKNITVRYIPTSFNLEYASFEIETDLCTAYFSCNGGVSGVGPTNSFLKITSPNGGETFGVGDNSVITWEGVAESDTVYLEKSIDNGINWTNISQNASGLKYNWQNIPNPASTKCLIRVSQKRNGNSTSDSVRALIGHTNNVNCIAFSPDGSKIVTGSYDKNVIIWDAYTSQIIKTFVGHNNIVRSVAFSPDGSKVVSGSDDKTAIIWDVNSGSILNTLNGHAWAVWCVAFSPDGNKIATGSYDKSAKIWDANTGSLIKTLIGHTDNIYSIAFSPNGSKIATGSADQNAIIWNANNGALLYTLTEHTHYINSVAFSPDGNKLATASWDSTVKIWDLNARTVIYTLKDHSSIVYGVAFSPDGNKLASSSFDSTAKLWNANTGSLIKTLKGHKHSVYNVAFSPDGSQLGTASWDYTAKIWDLDAQALQQDVSDKVFNIVAPSYTFQDINLKECLLGNSKDSLIENYIGKTTTFSYKVEKIYFTGTDANSFSLVSGIPPFLVTNSIGMNVEFRFKPNKIGIHNANITIVTSNDTIFKTIQGIGVQSPYSIVNKIIDFGKVNVGKTKDSLRVLTIKNTNPSQLVISKITIAGPNDIDFKSISKAQIILQKGDSAFIDLEFQPSDIGKTSGQLLLEYNGFGSPTTIQLFGEGVKILPSILVNDLKVPNIICESSKDTIIEIKNNGLDTLKIKKSAISGINLNDFSLGLNLTGKTILPDSILKVPITFNSKALGKRIALLQIQSNAYPDSNLTVNLEAYKDSINISSQVKTIDLGYICPSATKDTSVSLQNYGSLVSDFKVFLPSGFSSIETKTSMNLNEIYNYTFKFTGTPIEGVFSKTMTISDIDCGKSYKIELKGVIEAPKLNIKTVNISTNIGKIVTADIEIQNLSNRDIIITNATGFNAKFSLVGNPFPLQILANSKNTYKVQFTSDMNPKDSVDINYNLNLCNISAIGRIIGNSVSASATLEIGNFTANTGEEIEIPILLKDTLGLKSAGVRGFSTELLFNKTILFQNNQFPSYEESNFQVLVIDNLLLNRSNGAELVKLKFNIALGNDDETDLVFRNIKGVGGDADIQTIKGNFKIKNICKDGGTRLLSGTTQTNLFVIYPNPANDNIEIEYSNADNGLAEFKLINVLGEVVNSIILVKTQNGKAKMNLKDLPSGQYFGVFNTESINQNMIISVIR